jgi:hypothetical protein
MLEAMSTTRSPLTSETTRTVTPVQAPPVVSETQTALSQLTEDIGFTRTAVGTLSEHVADLHNRVRQALLAARTARLRDSGAQLLEELSDLGFAWRHVARLVGVSVPAVQKWRRGEKMSPENMDRVATLLATCDLIHNSFFVNDVASWFEIRILPDVPIRPMDLYAAGRSDLLLDWVSQHERDPLKLVSDFDPDWRERYDSDFEVFEATDGELALRFKDR